MTARRLRTPLLVAALVLCSAALAAAAPPASSIRVESAGRRSVASALPPLQLEDLDGRKVSLAALRGKVVLLNFWASWCHPCVAELPMLARLATKYADKGVVVVAASLDDESSRSAVERLAHAMQAVRVWVGASADDLARLELGSSLPVSVLLDPQGRIADRRRGEIDETAMAAKIDKLLAGGSEDDAPGKPDKPRFEGAIQARATESCPLRGPC